MKKIKLEIICMALLVVIFSLKSGLYAGSLTHNIQSTSLDLIFQEGKDIFYRELKLKLAFHPQTYRLLPESIQKIHKAEQGIPFLYENLINIVYLKERPHFQALLAKRDEESIRIFRREYLNLCRKTAKYFVQSLFVEEPEIDKFLLKKNNRDRSRLELVLSSFDSGGRLDKSKKSEFLSNLDSFNFQPKWILEVADFYETHKVTKGKGLKIALIDSGIRADYFDLQKAKINHAFDFCLVGRKLAPWVREDVPVFDENGQGTLMASIVSACAPEAEIRIYKIGYDKTPPYSFWPAMQIAQAIYKAVYDKADIIIVGHSFSRDFKFLQEACQYAYSQNVIIVAPSGSNVRGNPEKPCSFPAHYHSTIAVVGVIPDLEGKPLCPAECFASHYNSVAAPAFIGKIKDSGLMFKEERSIYQNSWASAVCGSLVALISARIPKTEKELHGQYFQRIYEILTTSADPRPLGFESFTPRIGYGLIKAGISVNQGLTRYLKKMKKIEEEFKKRMKQRAEEEKKRKKKKK